MKTNLWQLEALKNAIDDCKPFNTVFHDINLILMDSSPGLHLTKAIHLVSVVGVYHL